MNASKELGAKRNVYIDAILKDDPAIPARTAARLLHAEHPELFKSLEIARYSFRSRVGCTGSNHRKDLGATHGATYRQPFTGDALPAPTPFWDSTPFVFDTPLCGIVADIHIPFHDNAAVQLAVEYIVKRGAKDILIDGDALDHYQESDFSRVPDVATLTQEIEDGKQFFRWLRKRFKGRIVYKLGNHEERFTIKVHKALPEVGRLLDNMTAEKMGLADLGVEIVTDRRIVKIGYLHCLHGHELGRGTAVPVSPARSALLKARECSLVAHWHQKTEQRGRTISDRQEVSFSIGCLCHLRPHYAPINNWQHGFAVIERTDSAGGFVLDNRAIIGGRCV